MAEGLFDEIVTAVEHIAGDVEHLVTTAVRGMFGGGGGPVDAVRWEGMTNDQLAAAVRQLNSGPGANGVQQAADALATIAGDLQQIETTLHQQLQAIGVNWQSEASELAQEMTTESAAYTTTAGAASGANAAAVNAQGEAYAAAKNAVPNPSVLTGATAGGQPVSFLSAAGSILTGHNTDQAKAAATAKAARQQTVDALNTYTASSQSHVTSHQPLPAPPAVRLTPKPVDTGIGQTTTPAGYVPPQVTVPSGGGGLPGVPGTPVVGPVGGGTPPVVTGLPTVSGVVPPPAGGTGTSPVLPGMPTGGAPGATVPPGPGLPVPGGGTGVRVPGAPVTGGPGAPLAPGPISGVGAPSVPPAGGVSGAAAAASGALGGSLVEDAAVGSAIVGGTVGAGIGGAAARKDELVRSRDLMPDEPGEEATDARSQAARALAELEGDEAAEAGVAARIGATADLPPTLLEPAVADRDDDREHANRYGVDDEDMFGDGRMVVPPVLDGFDQHGDFGPTGSK
jgi:hypothetical protein